MEVVITAHLEMFERNSSGEECEYESIIVNEIVKLSEEYVNISLDELNSPSMFASLATLLPNPVEDMVEDLSETYCVCNEFGRCVYDYRYIIINVEYYIDVEKLCRKHKCRKVRD